MSTTIAEYNDIIDVCVEAIYNLCENCHSQIDIEDFVSKDLVKVNGKNNQVGYNSYIPGLEIFNSYSEKQNGFYDSGYIHYILFGKDCPASGYKSSFLIKRIGIELEVLDNCGTCSKEDIKADLIMLLTSKNIKKLLDYERVRESAQKDIIKRNVLSVKNLYYVVLLISRLIYKKIFMIVSPDTGKYYYIYPKSSVAIEYNDIYFNVEVGNHGSDSNILYFDQLDAGNKIKYLKRYFKLLFNSGFFVENIYTCQYSFKAFYNGKEVGEY